MTLITVYVKHELQSIITWSQGIWLRSFVTTSCPLWLLGKLEWVTLQWTSCPSCCALEIDGSSEVDHSKAVASSKNDHCSTNIETLTNKLSQSSVSHLAKEQKTKKPSHVDTSKIDYSMRSRIRLFRIVCRGLSSFPS